MATEQQVADFQRLVNECLQYSKTDIHAIAAHGDLNFSNVLPELRTGWRICSQLKRDLDYPSIPEFLAGQLLTVLSAFLNAQAHIANFRISHPNASNAHGQVSDAVRNAVRDLLDVASKFIRMFSNSDVEISAATAAIEKSKRDYDSMLEEYSQKIKEVLKDAATAADSAHAAEQKAAALAKTTTENAFYDHYSQAATLLGRIAVYWLVSSVLLGALCLLFAAGSWILPNIYPNLRPDYGTELLWMLSKITVLAILVSATVWSASNFRAVMHNRTINQQKALSFRTFPALSSSSTDEATKKALLLEAATSLFGHLPTGYLDTKSNAEFELKALDLLKAALPKTRD